MSAEPSADERPVLLFVDDDQRVLDGLSASLRRHRRRWKMEFLCGGASALRRIEGGARYDAVVTDMRMPGIDGEEVLAASRRHSPGALRVILSGQTDRYVVRRTVAITHQFLSKPCSAEELQGSLQRLLDFNAPLDLPTRELVLGVGELPASPFPLAQLRAFAAGEPPNPAEVASCIEQDVGLAAKLLHTASGGFFAQPQTVTSLVKAVRLLGSEQTCALLAPLDGYGLDGASVPLSSWSRATAQLLRRMLEGDEAQLCAALHAVGRLVLWARFGEAYAELLERSAAQPERSLGTLEQERFGMSHETVGAHLLGVWGCPPAVVQAVRALGRPELAAASSALARALYVADVLVRGGRIPDAVLMCADVQEHIDDWRAWAAENARASV